MGNCSSRLSVVSSNEQPISSREISEDRGTIETDRDINFNVVPAREEMDELLDQMQKHRFKRLKKEWTTDIHKFTLNNILMCTQFWNNFETAKQEAKTFKLRKEKEINEKLNAAPLDGTILAQRRAHLLHGMSQIVANHVVYKSDEDDEYSRELVETCFEPDAILPLEFLMYWSNLQVYEYEPSQWNEMQKLNHDGNTARFFMELSDDKSKIPRGFVRLRCMDVPKEIQPRSGTGTDEGSDDYTPLNDHDEGEKRSEESDSSSDQCFESGEDLLNNVAQYLNCTTNGTKIMRLNGIKNVASDMSPESDTTSSISVDIESISSRRKNSGILPPGFQFMLPKRTRSVEKKPKRISGRQNSHEEESDTRSRKHVDSQSHESLASTSWTKTQKPMSNLAVPNRPHNGKNARESPSSGYDSMSQSSLESEKIRARWRHLELKDLAQFRPKRRRPTNPKSLLSEQCFKPVEISMSDDEEENDESDSDSENEMMKLKQKLEEPKIIRYYLDSSNFSSEFCSEFHHTGPKMGINWQSMQNAMVLSSTIRCGVSLKKQESNTVDDEESEDDGPFICHIYTPALLTRSWPKKYILRLFRRLTKNSEEEEVWLTEHERDMIEALGMNAIPRGFKTIGFFNSHQCLEWELSFMRCETVLLNTFRAPHWRAYIFSSLIFRAFLAHLGPQGVGLEHIRNIIYFMCEKGYSKWNEEEPGEHLLTIIERLYECLGTGNMSSFFMHNRNLLKNVPKQNASLVQGHLKKVKDNPVVYCLYALKKLECVSKHKHKFPVPNWTRLFKILTVSNGDLLKIINTRLMGPSDFEPSEGSQRKTKPKRKKTLRRLSEKLHEEQDEIDEEYFKEFGGPGMPSYKRRNRHNGPDRVQEKLRKKYARYQMKKKAEAEEEWLKSAHHTRSVIEQEKLQKEKKMSSIDLKKFPVHHGSFSSERLELLVNFFIEQFLGMARVCNEHRAYAQATMYVLQADNLCKLLLQAGLGNVALEESVLHKHQETIQELRSVIGIDMRAYVRARLPNLYPEPEMDPKNPLSKSYGCTEDSFMANKENNINGVDTKSNWNLKKQEQKPQLKLKIPYNRTLKSDYGLNSNERPTLQKTLKPMIVNSLQSIPQIAELSYMEDDEKPITPITTVPHNVIAHKPRRTESVKFVDSFASKSMDELPKKSLNRTNSVITFPEFADSELESTDL